MICSNCRKDLTDEMFQSGICYSCGHTIQESMKEYEEKQKRIAKLEYEKSLALKQLKEKQKEQSLKEQADRYNNHYLTTGYSFEGYKITNYLGLVSGEVVLGTGYFTDIAANVLDILGAESKDYSDKIKQAKSKASHDMVTESVKKGGNAIIGISYQYLTFTGNMIGVSVNGTSVKIEAIPVS